MAKSKTLKVDEGDFEFGIMTIFMGLLSIIMSIKRSGDDRG